MRGLARAAAAAIPALRWARHYRREWLAPDLSAGLTVAVMLIPQAMAYALLAGLPPHVGLYAATVPLALYALFGSSRQLAVGPVAIVSLMTAAALSPFVADTLGLAPGTAEHTAAYVAAAALLMLLAGIASLVMGLLRLGFVVVFLSHPVVIGFTFAAAVIIGVSQIPTLLGLSIERGHYPHETLLAAAEAVDRIDPATAITGVLCVVLLIAIRRWKRWLPAQLIVVTLATLTVYAFQLQQHGVAIVGDVPAGLPPLSINAFSGDTLGVHIEALWLPALLIAIVGFVESFSVAKVLASRNHYALNANDELIGLGVANIGGAFVSGYPITGSISRTAVNGHAGAKTGLAGLVTMALIVLTLLLFTPLFHYLPTTALAAVIITAVAGLVDVKEARRIYRIRASDGLLLAGVFAATLFLGVEEGVLLGMGVGLAIYLFRTSRHSAAELGQHEATGEFVPIDEYPEARLQPGIAIVRVEAASVYFGNVDFLRRTLYAAEARQADPLHTLILDASRIPTLDSHAADVLDAIVHELRSRDIRFYLAAAPPSLRKTLAAAHLDQRIGEPFLPATVAAAIAHTQPPGEGPANGAPRET